MGDNAAQFERHSRSQSSPRVWRFVGWFLGAGSLALYGTFFFDWETMRSLVAEASASLTLLAVLAFCGALVVRSLKWTYLIRMKGEVSWARGIHTVMLSNLASFLLPIRIGEVLKLYLIKRVGNVDYSSSVSATLTDRVSLLIIIGGGLWFAPLAGFQAIHSSVRLITFLVPLGMIVVGIFILGTGAFERYEASLVRTAERFSRPGSHLRKLADSGLPFVRSILEKTHISSYTGRQLSAILVLSTMTLALDGLYFALIIGAFGLEVTWTQGVLGACFMNLLFVLPTPPAQLGTAEMYPVIVFSWGLGLAAPVISSVALTWHLLTGAVLVIVGLTSGVALGVSVGEVIDRLRANGFAETS